MTDNVVEGEDASASPVPTSKVLLGCQANVMQGGEVVSPAALHLGVGGGAEEALLNEIRRVHATLLDRLKLKYAGDCKCGNCFLVPGDVILNAANLISYSLRRQDEEPKQSVGDERHPRVETLA